MNYTIQPLLAVLLFAVILAGCTGQDNHTVSVPPEHKSDDRFSDLKAELRSGTPKEKEEVLNLFMKEHLVELVPSVINAILDDTVSPRHGDTGWARVHHQAATAMCKFAYRFDGKSPKERGRDAYSFYNDGGVGTEARINEVHKNWAKWWKQNETNITKRSTATP